MLFKLNPTLEDKLQQFQNSEVINRDRLYTRIEFVGIY